MPPAASTAAPAKAILHCSDGGAIHELELYLTVSRCAGVEPGLYHYDPLAHELEHVAVLGPLQKRLLARACASSGSETPSDVLITLAARFQRMAWKYQSMAYAATLKNAGVLYQQMYLVAAAMDLAPCACSPRQRGLIISSRLPWGNSCFRAIERTEDGNPVAAGCPRSRVCPPPNLTMTIVKVLLETMMHV